MKKYLVLMACVSIIISVVMISVKATAQEESGMTAVDASIQVKLEELKKIYSTEIIMGAPMEVDGRKIIPLAIAGFGFGQPGMQAAEEKMQREMGGGAGGVMIPVAIIVVSDKGVQLIQLSKGFVEQLVGALAPVVVQILSRQSGTGKESDVIQGTAIPEKGGKTAIGEALLAFYIRIATLLALGWLLLILIIEAFLPQQVKTVISTLRQNYVRAGLVGLLGYGVAFLMMAVFTMSLIGIPLTFIVVILTCVLTLFGTVGLALMIGQRITAALKRPDYSDMLCTLIGGLVMGIIGIVVGIIPIFGWIVWTIVGILGFGTTLQIQWQAVRKKEA